MSRHAAVLAACLLPAALAAQAPDPAARIDSLAMAPVREEQVAGLAVLVTRGADTLLARGYGRADLENEVPMHADQVFQFASITKEFTAAAVLRLVADGRVELDAPITRYLPGVPLQGHTVTVRQLLSHTAGIVDYAESPRLREMRARDLPPDTLLAVAAGSPFYFTPGTRMRYSNTGFVLLGMLIERVSGRPYGDFVRDEVLRPAGAVGAHFCDPRRVVPRLARGYTMTAEGIVPAEYISPHVPYAAGAFCGTAGDLAAWNAALHGGRVLPPALYEEMVRPAVVEGRAARYGLGLSLWPIGGRRAFHHGGDIYGFTTYSAYFPDDSLNVTVLINTQGPTRPDALVAAIADAVLGPRAASPAPAPPVLGGLAGHYDEADFEVAQTDSGPMLRMKRGPMPPVLLRYEGEMTFSDGRGRFTFEPAGVWADLGVSLVYWPRGARP